MRRPSVVKLVGSLALACLTATIGMRTASTGAQVHRELLDPNDHVLLARALAEGKTRDRFIVACGDEPAVTRRVAAVLAAGGATVERTVPRIGYLRAVIPFAKLDALMDDPDVELVDLLPDNQFDYDLTAAPNVPGPAPALAPSALPTPGPHTPSVNAFTGLRAMAVPQFREEHPTYDGRGTIVGLLEPAPPDAPGLQWGRDLAGHRIPKIVAYGVDQGPHDQSMYGGTDNANLGWVRTLVVHAQSGVFRSRGVTYHAPFDGTFRFGMYTLSRGKDLSYTYPAYVKARAVVPPDAFPLLWDEATSEVWIDTRQDGRFDHESPLRPYGAGGRNLGWLPVAFGNWKRYGHNGRGPGSQRMEVIVSLDAADHFVYVGRPGLESHAGMVAGSATGNGFFGGAFDGVAPGARLAIAGGYYPYLIEGLVQLAQEHSDVISMSFTFTPHVSGTGVIDRMIDRISRTYGVVIVVAASNAGPTLETVGSPSTSSDAISVGAYVSSETARYDEGAVFPNPRGLLAIYSSRGPAGDGAMKPDILAQTEWLSSGTPEQPMQPFRQSLFLPRGYELGGGTSQAAPTAAGAVALLVSGAKQASLAYRPAWLKLALVSSGSALPFERAETGGGLVDVDAAWRTLQLLATDPPPAIAASAPVRTADSDELWRPDAGRGLFEREGWTAGMRATRTIAYTLAAGARARTYAVSVVGDAATFTAPPTVTLEPGRPVALPVRIAPGHPGLHSALVELRDPRTHEPADVRLCTIIAAERFSPQADDAIVHTGRVDHPGVARHFFEVPRGATAFTVDVKVRGTGIATHFDPFSASRFVEVKQPDGQSQGNADRFTLLNEGLHWEQSFELPMAGVWEVDVTNEDPGTFFAYPDRAEPVPPTTYDLRASVSGLVGNTSRTTPSSVRIAVVNALAPIHLDAVDVELAHTHARQVDLAPGHEQVVLPFTVPPGAGDVFARLGHVPPEADVHVDLFNCAKNVPAQRENYFYRGACWLVGSAGSRHDDGIASTANPRNWVSALYWRPTSPAGRWVAVVDGAHLTAPLRTGVVIGIVDASSRRELPIAHRLIRADERYAQTVRIPQAWRRPGSTVLVALRSTDAATTWQRNESDLIATMKVSKPKLLHRAGVVWRGEIAP